MEIVKKRGRGRPKGSPDGHKRVRRGVMPKSASSTLRQLFWRLDRSGMTMYELADAARMLPTSLSYYRHGVQTPNIMKVEELADILGYELKLVKKEKTDATA